ncbi:MAG: PAS domain S-box protein [Acidobacteria bacterium]|nr:MAG: PAS domain S-box protein [Acidobacteriota bacterium]REK08511.1 MAG: PAS domain S-box protein [Acidobacteriota bacterium]
MAAPGRGTLGFFLRNTMYDTEQSTSGPGALLARAGDPSADASDPPAKGAPSPIASTEQLAEFFELSSDLLCIAGLDGYYRRVNASFPRVLGLSREELYSRPIVELVHPDDRAATLAELRKLGDGRPTVSFENRYRCADGSWRTLSWNAVSLPDQGLVYGIARDVTAERAAQERLRVQGRILDAITDIVYSRDEHGIVRYWNRGAEELLGRSAQRTIGRPLSDLADSLVEPEKLLEVSRTVDSGRSWSGDLLLKKVDGTVATCLATVDPIFDGLGAYRGSVGVLRDVTEARRHAKRLEGILTHAPVPIAELSVDGICLEANAPAEALFGLRPGELRGRDVRELFDDPRAGCLLAERLVEAERRRRPLLTEDELHLAGRNRVLRSLLFPVFEDDGVVRSIGAVIEDLTHQREAADEKHQLEVQLAQSQKMEAVGRLAGGIAHDFNNILTVICGTAELLRAGFDSHHPQQEDVEEIHEQAQRAARLTRQLLTFSRHEVQKPRCLDLAEVVSSLGGLLRRVIGEDVELRLRASAGEHHVFSDPVRLEQVLLNLAVNARDAMPDGGVLEIVTGDCVLQRSMTCSTGTVPPGRYVTLAVRDTGSGIPPEIVSQIFEPFFTTKDPGKGTGLGLSTVYGIVLQGRGHIQVDSELGQGSCFTIYLPSSTERDRSHRADSQRIDPIGGNERILLVEDDDAVRQVAARALRSRGYTVLEAEGGRTALELLETEADEVDLVLTDMVMPEMGGAKLAEEIARRLPDTPLMLMSGYADERVADLSQRDLFRAVIEKPFSALQLAAGVRDVLDRDGLGG